MDSVINKSTDQIAPNRLASELATSPKPTNTAELKQAWQVNTSHLVRDNVLPDLAISGLNNKASAFPFDVSNSVIAPNLRVDAANNGNTARIPLDVPGGSQAHGLQQDGTREVSTQVSNLTHDLMKLWQTVYGNLSNQSNLMKTIKEALNPGGSGSSHNQSQDSTDSGGSKHHAKHKKHHKKHHHSKHKSHKSQGHSGSSHHTSDSPASDGGGQNPPLDQPPQSPGSGQRQPPTDTSPGAAKPPDAVPPTGGHLLQHSDFTNTLGSGWKYEGTSGRYSFGTDPLGQHQGNVLKIDYQTGDNFLTPNAHNPRNELHGKTYMQAGHTYDIQFQNMTPDANLGATFAQLHGTGTHPPIKLESTADGSVFIDFHTSPNDASTQHVKLVGVTAADMQNKWNTWDMKITPGQNAQFAMSLNGKPITFDVNGQKTNKLQNFSTEDQLYFKEGIYKLTGDRRSTRIYLGPVNIYEIPPI